MQLIDFQNTGCTVPVETLEQSFDVPMSFTMSGQPTAVEIDEGGKIARVTVKFTSLSRIGDGEEVFVTFETPMYIDVPYGSLCDWMAT